MDRRASPSENWVKDAVLYQIFVRNFSAAGDFQSVASKLGDLATLGVNVLWLMPLHPIGLKMRKGALGCPYAVQNYEQICPALGTRSDFQELVRAAHQLGMRVIVDWVANHTSWDSHLIQHQPHFFKRGRKRVAKQRQINDVDPPNGEDAGNIFPDEKEVTIEDVRERIQREAMMNEYEVEAVRDAPRVANDDEEEEEEEVILPPMDAWWDVAALDYGPPDSDDEEKGFHIPEPAINIPGPEERQEREINIVDTDAATTHQRRLRRQQKKKKTEAQRALGDYMAGVMKDWVRSFDIDGFRCDVSEMVPTFFWRRVVSEIKDEVKPSVMMLSEGTLPEHHIGAFDITYAWNIYEALTAVVRGTQPATHLHQVLEAEALEYPEGALRLRFISNHDKNVQDGSPLEHFGSVSATLATSAFTFTMGGYRSIRSVPMLYNGDEAGNALRLSLFDQSVIPWNELVAGPTAALFRRHYERLIALRRRRRAVLVHGSMQRATTTHDDCVFAFVRTARSCEQGDGDEEDEDDDKEVVAVEALVVVNLRDQALDEVRVNLPQRFSRGADEQPITTTTLEDWYSEEKEDDLFLLDRSGKLVLRALPPFGFRILGVYRAGEKNTI